MLQPTIEEEPEEEATGKVVVTEEVAVLAVEPVAETAADKDAMLQDVPAVVPVAKVGPSADTTRTTPRDAVEELLRIRLDGTIQGCFKLSLAEIAWQNLQETCKLCKLSDWQERLEQMMIR